MKFYVVDNGSSHLNEIVARIEDAGHEAVVEKHRPQKILDPKDADYIVLSGGMQNEVVDVNFDGSPWYANEFALIRSTDKPILGICLGLQMIVVALGGTLTTIPEMIKKDKTIPLSKKAQSFLGGNQITVREAHRWVADTIEGTGLDVVLESDDGVELLVSHTRPIIATQFHPEVDVEGFDSKGLFWNLIEYNLQKVGAK